MENVSLQLSKIFDQDQIYRQDLNHHLMIAQRYDLNRCICQMISKYLASDLLKGNQKFQDVLTALEQLPE